MKRSHFRGITAIKAERRKPSCESKNRFSRNFRIGLKAFFETQRHREHGVFGKWVVRSGFAMVMDRNWPLLLPLSTARCRTTAWQRRLVGVMILPQVPSTARRAVSGKSEKNPSTLSCSIRT